MDIVRALLYFTVGATGVEPETVIFGGWKLGRNRSTSSTRRGHSGTLPQFVTFGEFSCYTSLHGWKMNERWSACVSWLYEISLAGIIFSKIIIFSIWVYVLNPVFSVVFRMFLQQSFSLEQRVGNAVGELMMTPFGTMDPSLRPFRNRCFCLGRRWGCLMGSHLFCLGKTPGWGGVEEEVHVTEGKCWPPFTKLRSWNAIFVEMKMYFDPSRTLEKIPAGRSKAFFSWAGVKTCVIFMTVYKVTLPTYIWITTNHCKDPY